MISSEFAHRLKDAGFPGSETWRLENADSARPTLSELITECAKEYFRLYFRPNEEKESRRWKVRCMANSRGGTTYGKTPEDAVALAWLIANEPQNSK